MQRSHEAEGIGRADNLATWRVASSPYCTKVLSGLKHTKSQVSLEIQYSTDQPSSKGRTIDAMCKDHFQTRLLSFAIEGHSREGEQALYALRESSFFLVL